MRVVTCVNCEARLIGEKISGILSAAGVNFVQAELHVLDRSRSEFYRYVKKSKDRLRDPTL